MSRILISGIQQCPPCRSRADTDIFLPTKAGHKASWHTTQAYCAIHISYSGYGGRSWGTAGFARAPPPRGHVLTISRWFQRLSSKEALAGISAHCTPAAAWAHTCSKFHSFQRISVQGFFALSFFGKWKLLGLLKSGLLHRPRGFSPSQIPHSCTSVWIFGYHHQALKESQIAALLQKFQLQGELQLSDRSNKKRAEGSTAGRHSGLWLLGTQLKHVSAGSALLSTCCKALCFP